MILMVWYFESVFLICMEYLRIQKIIFWYNFARFWCIFQWFLQVFSIFKFLLKLYDRIFSLGFWWSFGKGMAWWFNWTGRICFILYFFLYEVYIISQSVVIIVFSRFANCFSDCCFSENLDWFSLEEKTGFTDC
jgi:hypothetical protein